MTGIMKAQIDWIPLTEGAVRPSQGKTLVVMQISGAPSLLTRLIKYAF
ncbi:arsenical resistance protein ArsH [Serratia liquefaciens]|nr:arsenical resistance protein ArsH [Serratia liquefaciens]